MAVTTGYVGSAAITWSASTTATVTGQSIGTAAWDRIVLVAVSVEDNVDLSSCTIGGVTANVAAQARDTGGTPDNTVRFFWLPVATGTTANIVVTASASISQTGRISVWAVTGAYPAISDSNTNTGSGTTLTLTGVTINPNGAGFWAFNNATTGTAVTWTNATERDDTSVGNYRHSVADSTTAGTATITADGATANQAIVGVSFDDAIPTFGWDHTPQNEKAVYTSARAVAMASMAAGLVLAPMPPAEAPPAFYSFDVTTSFVARRSVNYQDLFQVQRPIPPSPVQVAGGTTTSSVGTRTLFYQALAQPLPPIAAPVQVTPDQWLIKWDRAPHYVPPLAGGIVVPPTPSNLTTTLEWQTNWRGPPLGRLGLPGGQPFVPREAVLENTVTPDNWLQAFRGAPRVLLGLPGGAPFVPKEAVLENTVTPDYWLRPFQGAVARPPVPRTDVTYPPSAPTVATNLTTTLEWLAQWQLPPRYTPAGSKLFTPFVPREAVLENTVTPDNWLQRWQGPPRYWPIKVHTPPFIPKEAVLENTVTPDKWLLAFRGAPPSRPIYTQPILGYPYVAQANLTTTLEWLQPFAIPPRYQPAKILAQPFIPKEAVLENTVTPDKWLLGFQKAVPNRPTWHTQPFFGYPYVSAPTLTTTLEWLQAFKGPPRYLPVKLVAQPFVPRAATLENTITPDKWLRGFEAARPRPPVRLGQAELRPLAPTPPAFYATSVITSQVRARPSLFYQASVRPLVEPPPPPPNTETIDKWQQPLSRPAKRPPVFKAQVTYLRPGVLQLPPLCMHVEIVFPTASVEVVFNTAEVDVTYPTSQTVIAECPGGERQCAEAFQPSVFQDDGFQTCEDVV